MGSVVPQWVRGCSLFTSLWGPVPALASEGVTAQWSYDHLPKAADTQRLQPPPLKAAKVPAGSSHRLAHITQGLIPFSPEQYPLGLPAARQPGPASRWAPGAPKPFPDGGAAPGSASHLKAVVSGLISLFVLTAYPHTHPAAHPHPTAHPPHSSHCPHPTLNPCPPPHSSRCSCLSPTAGHWIPLSTRSPSGGTSMAQSSPTVCSHPATEVRAQ